MTTAEARPGTNSSPIESLTPLVAQYEIPFEEFDTRPRGSMRYVFPARVQRSNFSTFLIYSFAVSGGNPDLQRAFCEWTYLNQGFDYQATFQNFTDAGGVNSLSRRERKEVRDAFVHVRRHAEDRITYDGLSEAVSKILSELPDYEWELLTPQQDLVGMPPKALEDLLKEERGRRRTAKDLRSQAYRLRSSTHPEDKERLAIQRSLLTHPTGNDVSSTRFSRQLNESNKVLFSCCFSSRNR